MTKKGTFMKHIPLIAVILLALLTCGLFAADFYLFTVPVTVICILLGILALLTVLLFFVQKKKAPRIIAVLLTIATAAASCGGILLNPYFNGISFHQNESPTLPYDTLIPADKAADDLAYAVRYFRKVHPVMLDGDPAPLLDKAAEAEKRIRSGGSITVNALTAEIEQIFAPLGDAHTSAFANYAEPLYLKQYYKWKKGDWAITAVNGIPMKELLTRSSELFSYEAESWEQHQLGGYLITVQGLDYLGFDVNDGITYTFENEAGETQTETYAAADYVTFDDYIAYNGEESTKASRDEPFVRFTIDKEHDLALLTLDECIFNEEYTNCLRDLFTQVRAQNIRNVAVDLRSNGGGNDRTAFEFIRYLNHDTVQYVSTSVRRGPIMRRDEAEQSSPVSRYTDLTFDGNVYVLTSAGSFSSAMLFALYIKDNRFGTIIGEPPGNDPNGYGDIVTFSTPNAGIRFSVSTKHFYRVDKSCTDQYVMPDIPCNADDALDMLYAQLS